MGIENDPFQLGPLMQEMDVVKHGASKKRGHEIEQELLMVQAVDVKLVFIRRIFWFRKDPDVDVFLFRTKRLDAALHVPGQDVPESIRGTCEIKKCFKCVVYHCVSLAFCRTSLL